MSDAQANKQEPEEQRGLVCPPCGCWHSRVVYTRASLGGRILRRRECRRCGKRVMTTERLTG
jgi:transcriptional regulator NrdR family protein